MVEGLAERERLREVFGTYLDKSIAEYILSEGFAEEGEELEVSVLVCDVRDFTSFAARSSAKEVVSRLNELFEIVVPIVGRHGGHVDKFLGDGLLGVFGAPEPYPDHADRAVLAACEMASKVNSRDDLGLKIGVGVNTGLVVAGSIGGGGRLNFSVIGDAVNVAARVEAATREVGEDVLITARTRRAADVRDPGRELRRADPEGDRRAGGALRAARGVGGPAARRGAAAGPRGDRARTASSATRAARPAAWRSSRPRGRRRPAGLAPDAPPGDLGERRAGVLAQAAGRSRPRAGPWRACGPGRPRG